MDWILNTGLSMVYTMILSVFLSNFKVLSEYLVYYVQIWRQKLFSKPEEILPCIEMRRIQGY